MARGRACDLFLLLAMMVGSAGSCAGEEEPPSIVTTLSDDCGDVTYDGYCDADGALIYCSKDGLLLREDCPTGDKICHGSAFLPGFFCMSPCPEGLTRAGRCADGNVLEYCVGGYLYDEKCAEYSPYTGTDVTCAWVRERCSYDCVGCGSLTRTGACEGNTLADCRDGIAHWTDCEASNRTCGFDEMLGEMNCIPFKVACDPPAAPAVCSGDVMEWCVDGTYYRFDCQRWGTKCVEDSEANSVSCTGCDPAWSESQCISGYKATCDVDVLRVDSCRQVCSVPE